MAGAAGRSLGELIGRTDLLEVLPGDTAKQNNLDLTLLLGGSNIAADKPQFCEVEKNPPFDRGLLAEEMVKLAKGAIDAKSGGEFELEICNCDRSIGARVSGEIARQHGNQAWRARRSPSASLGTAGQSFGVWNAGGLNLYRRRRQRLRRQGYDRRQAGSPRRRAPALSVAGFGDHRQHLPVRRHWRQAVRCRHRG